MGDEHLPDRAAAAPDAWDLRVGDAERDQVAEALRMAAGDGRLTLTELEERLESALTARTYRDLVPLVHDIPGALSPVPPGQPAAVAATPAALPMPLGPETPMRLTAILGSEARSGAWQPSAHITATTFMGEIKLDFVQALVRHHEIIVDAVSILGSVTLVVPEGVDVRLEPGASILGERKSTMKSSPTPGAPVIRVRGTAVLGEIEIRPPKRRELPRSPA